MNDTTFGLMRQVDELLHHRFGLRAFRTPQKEIILKALGGESQLAILPTGSGKSLCYQLPSLLLPHPTIVISPLIALMKDQVDSLAAKGISAHALTGSLSTTEQQQILDDWACHAVPLIYLAPERLSHPLVIAGLRRGLKISLLVVDEAHCISEWGHDFRPDYRRIREFRELADNPPVMALTATAPARVRRDIVYQLGTPQSPLVTHETSVDRPNLHLGVRIAVSSREQRRLMTQAIEDNPHPTIVYAGTRRQAEEWGEWLRGSQSRRVRVYHAGLGPQIRKDVQEGFTAGTIPIVVATTAFGMGINRSDVGLVIHVAVPESLASYYQEVGRAGRDGLPAKARMIIRYRDFEQREMRLRSSEPDPAHIMRMVSAMAELPVNRQVRWELDDEEMLGPIVLAALHDMQMVKVGDKSGRAIAVTRKADFDALTVPSIVHRLRQQHQYRMEQFRFMKEYVFSEMCRRQVIGQYFGQTLLPAPNVCCDICDGRQHPQLRNTVPDWSVVTELRQWRAEVARQTGVAPYIVLTDKAIQSMALALPKTLDDLQLCPGIGPVKRDRYGAQLLEIMRPFSVQRPMAGDASEVLQTPKTLAIAMFREGIPISEVQRRIDRAHTTVMGYLTEWIDTRSAEEWAHYVFRMMPADSYRQIAEVFGRIGADRLRPVYDGLSQAFPYDILRIAQSVFRKGVQP